LTTVLSFRRLTILDFRNIEQIDFEPSDRFNVIAGDNGQGKTSLIEALYFVSTTRSFRAEKLREMVRDGSRQAQVRAEVEEDGLRRELRTTATTASRIVTLDGKRPQRLATYATLTPVVAFHPGDVELVSGPASLRRRLLDRVALFVDPASADHRQRYERAQRARQSALDERGVHAGDLDAFEQVMAEDGAWLERSRRLAAEHLTEALVPAFIAMLATTSVELSVRFVPGGTEDVLAFREELGRRRHADLRRGSATFGPHRDELEMNLDGRLTRRHASQGQQRILTLAIKSAELECVRQVRGTHPILLLDDVSSELDPTRTGAVYDFLRRTPGQVFVTTTRPELFETPGILPGERADFTLVGGAIVL
jgi:DNA replication and repair protein RecF